MDRQRRPSTAALEAFVEDSFNRRKRKSTPPQPSTTASGASAETIYEHYKFDEQESSIHLEWRAQRGQAQLRMMRIVTEVFVYSLGLGLGLLVGSMTIASRVRPAPSLPLPCPRTPQPFALPSLTLAYPRLRHCTMWSCGRRTWHCTQTAPRGRLTWAPPSPPTRGSTC